MYTERRLGFLYAFQLINFVMAQITALKSNIQLVKAVGTPVVSNEDAKSDRVYPIGASKKRNVCSSLVMYISIDLLDEGGASPVEFNANPI